MARLFRPTGVAFPPADRQPRDAVAGAVVSLTVDRNAIQLMEHDVSGVAANVTEGLRFNWTQGSDATLLSLGTHGFQVVLRGDAAVPDATSGTASASVLRYFICP